ncbi:MAG: glycosyltransferase family 2 protein [bacterium]|nr:glycosyltransferase family 2 protein [bacterium]
MSEETTGKAKVPAIYTSIWAVIPAYNEQRRVREAVRQVKQYIPNIVVVDDCSKDRTDKEAALGGAHVLRHPINRGQGAALRTGMDYALAQGAHIIVHFDADGQMLASQIPSMIKPILEGRADIALGSRFIDNSSKIPAMRRFVLKGGILFTHIISGLNLTDTHNGFRAMNRYAADKIQIVQDRYSHASEILDEIAKHKLRYVEVPVTTLYNDEIMVAAQARGQNSLNALKIAARVIWSKLSS